MRQFRIRGRRRNLILAILGLFVGSFVILDFNHRTTSGLVSQGEQGGQYEQGGQGGHGGQAQLVFSRKLRSRVPWENDQECSHYNISHLVPK